MADNEWVDVSHELQNSNDGWEDVSHELRPEHKLDSALEGVAQGLTANYANNLRAAAQKPIFAVLNALTGQDVEPDDYVKARDSFNRNTKALQEENPVSFGAGQLGGGVVQGLAAGGLLGSALKGAQGIKGVGTVAKALSSQPSGLVGKVLAGAGKGAATGAAYSALANPGDTEGKIDDMQLNERAGNALTGAEFGGAIGGAGAMLGHALDSHQAMKSLAREKAVKSLGAMKREMNALGPKGVDSLGEALLEDNIVSPLSTKASMADKLQQKISDYSGKVKSAISQADDILGRPEGFTLENATPEEILAAKAGNLSTNDIKNQVVDRFRKSMSGVPEDELSPAINKIETWFKNRPEQMTADELQELKQSLNNFLSKSDYYKDMPGISKEGYLAVRRGAKEAIEQKGDAAAKILGDPTGQIKLANKRLGQMLEAHDISQDGIARDAANNSFSLGDKIAGIGAAAGVAAHSPHTIGAAFLGSIGNKGLRAFGNQTAAVGLNKLSDTFQKMSPAFQKMSEANPQAFNLMMQSFLSNPKFNANPDMAPQDSFLQKPMAQDPKFIESIQNPKLRDALEKNQDLQSGGAENNFKDKIPEDEAKARFIEGN